MFFGSKVAVRVTAVATLLELANKIIPQCNRCCARKVLENWQWVCPHGCGQYVFAMPTPVVDIAELYASQSLAPWIT
jgi:hypothetical protein